MGSFAQRDAEGQKEEGRDSERRIQSEGGFQKP